MISKENVNENAEMIQSEGVVKNEPTTSKAEIEIEEEVKSVKENMLISQESLKNNLQISNIEEETDKIKAETANQQAQIDFSSIDTKKYCEIIFRLINKKRTTLNHAEFIDDIGLKRLASEHSTYSKQGYNDEFIRSKLNSYDYKNEYKVISFNYEFLDYNDDMTGKDLEDVIVDLLNLLFELETEKTILIDPSYNCIGVGLSFDEKGLYFSMLISYTPISFEGIRKNAEGKLEIVGKVLEEDKGLYAAKILNYHTGSEIMLITFQNIIFDLESSKFVIEVDFRQEIEDSLKLIEFYLKTDPESIKYGYKTKIKYLSKAYEVHLKIPLEVYPQITMINSRLLTGYSSEHYENNSARSVSEIKKRFSQVNNDHTQNSKYVTRNGMVIEEKSENEDSSDSEENNSSSSQNENESIHTDNKLSQKSHEKLLDDSISEFYFEADANGDMDGYNDTNLRVELETAIHQALQEIKKQITQNKKLQNNLLVMWDYTGIKVYNTEDNNDGINEIKYHNALALIHQIRKELDDIKSKYDKAAREMNTKLEEKMENYNKIKTTFFNLRKEISGKAVYETNLKKVPPKFIEEIEENENEINDKYQQLRLDIIKTRLAIEKKMKNLKEKEQLAEGLHLIDFEKLKIENQSLNEKLEERNEEIYKLQKKNTLNVQILSHLKQKLFFEENEVSKKIKNLKEKGYIIRRGL